MTGVRQLFSGFREFSVSPPVPCYRRADPFLARGCSGLLWGERAVAQT